jgi:VIT1/CCC1 family predicted Fe2+/Mn2+ transporter
MTDRIAPRQNSPLVHTGSGLVSLHPTVYRIITALAGVFILAAWSFFGPGSGVGHYTALALAVATLFVGFVIAIPADIAHVWRRHHELAKEPGTSNDSFRLWLRQDVVIRHGRMSGAAAAFAALLPVAACAVGMVLLALAHALTVGAV